MPVLGIDIFSSPPADEAATDEGNVVAEPEQPEISARAIDTIVCPAWEDGFARAFLGQRAWWAVRIAERNIPKIKYLALYQVAPISAITYYGEVGRIEPWEKKGGKFKLYLRGEPIRLSEPVTLGGNRNLKVQGPKYTTLEALLRARTLDDLFGGKARRG
jgi:hypothetical protein